MFHGQWRGLLADKRSREHVLIDCQALTEHWPSQVLLLTAGITCCNYGQIQVLDWMLD